MVPAGSPTPSRSLQQKSLAADRVALAIDLRQVKFENLCPGSPAPIGHKLHMHCAELPPIELRRLELCRGLRNKQPPVGQLLKALAFNPLFGPSRERPAKLNDDVPPIKERCATPLGRLKEKMCWAPFASEISNYDIREAHTIAVRINNGDVLPDDIVVVLDVRIEVRGLGRRHAERRRR